MTGPVVDPRPVVDAIEIAITEGGVLFGDGKKPKDVGNKPYVVGFFDAGTVTDKTMRSRDGWSIVASFQCAGLSPDATRLAVWRVRQAVLGLRGWTIQGREVGMPVHLGGPPMDKDDDADPPLFIQIDEWRIRLS